MSAPRWIRPGRGEALAAAAISRAALTGLAGTGFHIYNVLKRPGRLAWQNLFYGAPLSAPMAILLAGLLRAAAEEVRHTPRAASARVYSVCPRVR